MSPASTSSPAPIVALGDTSPTPISPSTGQEITLAPVDEWANAVLGVALPQIAQSNTALDGLVWWQGGDLTGRLTVERSEIKLGTAPLTPLQETRVSVLIPDPSDPSELLTIARVERETGALALQVNTIEAPIVVSNWRISAGAAGAALENLVRQAAERDLLLIAAYVRTADQSGQLALVGTEQMFTTDADTPTPTLTPDVTLTPSLTAEPSATPTPTREPDAYLQRLMAAAADAVIVESETYTSNAVYEFAFGHPRTGPLRWTETGPTVGGQPMALKDADELTFYSLVPDDVEGTTQRLFPVVYDGTVTRLPDEQVYFQGHRLGEVIYWIVRRAAEQNGQLLVVYDDFGVTQRLTFIGFQPFDGPTPTP